MSRCNEWGASSGSRYITFLLCCLNLPIWSGCLNLFKVLPIWELWQMWSKMDSAQCGHWPKLEGDKVLREQCDSSTGYSKDTPAFEPSTRVMRQVTGERGQNNSRWKEPDKIYSLGASLPLIDMSEAMQVHVCAVLWILWICVESWIGK